MNDSRSVRMLRATIFHVPQSPFRDGDGMVALSDGALVTRGGRIVACDDYGKLRDRYPDAAVDDRRGSYILPGFIDTHVHFPQVRIIGALGYSLLDWLDKVALPEEARLADTSYARTIAQEFLHALASNGTTTALVFGSHFPDATAALLETAEHRGIRVFSGLVLADRGLRPELRRTARQAYDDCRALIARFRTTYVVTPRFALSTTPDMLEVCRTLLRETPSLRFTTHINENPDEISGVLHLFPDAKDYLAVYERFDLVGRRSVLAHNVHAGASELCRIRAQDASVAHCPASNAALGSGVFPMRGHVEAGVRFALGTDVGAGAGFGMLKEAMQAYLLQRIAVEPMLLSPAQMLYLATRAGAEALALENETGDFCAGKSADFVCIRPEAASLLESALGNAESEARALGVLITLASHTDIQEVRIEDQVVYARRPAA
jgi:guanine deaminase